MSETLHARVRRLYGYAVAWRDDVPDDRPDLQKMQATAFAEFDQLIDQVRQQAEVEALKEAAEELGDTMLTTVWEAHDYLVDRADQLKQEGKNNE